MSGYSPTDVANQALDACAWPRVFGEIEDGSDESQILLRAYRQCLMQLLRAANWSFARQQAPLELLADASGNTPDVGTLVPTPWVYEYAYPIDCMRVRFIPWNLNNQADLVPSNNIQIPSTPLVGGIGQQPALGVPIRPARFVVATDFNYPPPAGTLTWDVQGVSPQGRTVVLTNVRNANAVYTSLVLYPTLWDPLFRSALVAYIASEVVMALWAKTDRKFGMQIRGEQIALVKAKVSEARALDGSEGTPTSDIVAPWMRARHTGGSWRGWGWGGGASGSDGGYGNSSIMLADGTVF